MLDVASRFHQEAFDPGTQIKLDLFRRYIRKWVPVSLTRQLHANYAPRPMHIFDFFAGPGEDTKGVPGSPLIIMEELRSYCEDNEAIRIPNPNVTLHFSDGDAHNIEALKERVQEHLCPRGCCTADVAGRQFHDALQGALPTLRSDETACLVIMDQFGLKEVTPAVVNDLSQCPVTDMLFFVSSSFIRRFAAEDAVQKYFAVSADELRQSDYRSIHRYVCRYFQSRLPDGHAYHLVPFSIKKGSNIYGVIFGSSNVLGLLKFLEACWDLDGVTGEANYPVDGDLVWHGQTLFEELNVTKKQDVFRNSLEERIRERTASHVLRGATNRELFRMTLEHGFLPKHATAELRRLQKDGRIEVVTSDGEKVRQGAFYVSLDAYKAPDKRIRAIVRYKETGQ